MPVPIFSTDTIGLIGNISVIISSATPSVSAVKSNIYADSPMVTVNISPLVSYIAFTSALCGVLIKLIIISTCQSP